MHIVVGSLNPVKKLAVTSVFDTLYPDVIYSTVNVPSGVPDQPWGDAETRTGAINRAKAAQSQTQADFGIGLEGGLIQTELGIMTCAWCAVYGSAEQLGVGGGSHMMLPPAAAAQLAQGMELGLVMDNLTDQHNTKHSLGAIGLMTDGLETRQTAYAHILRLALAPLRSPAHFNHRPI